MWPYFPDVTHPGDKGYALYADAAWAGFLEAVEQGLVCRAPEKMVHAETYLHWVRQPISALGVLPKGWKAGLPNTLGSAFDFYMSRWLDDVTVATAGAETLRVKVRGATIVLFGEATPLSGKLLVKVDGQPTGGPASDGVWNANRTAGVMPLVCVVAQGLDPAKEYVLELTPQAWRGAGAEDRKHLRGWRRSGRFVIEMTLFRHATVTNVLQRSEEACILYKCSSL